MATNSNVGVVVPVRRLPVGPPFSIQFQARASILSMDDQEIISLVEQGEPARSTSADPTATVGSPP